MKKYKFLIYCRRWLARNVWFKRFPWLYAHYFYWERTGRELNWHQPEDFNQKLFWLHRYWQHPLIVQCADKLAVRDYVKDCGYEHLLIPVYAIYNDVDEIDLSNLPERFVLKCNHGSGFNIICKDKSLLDVDKAKQTLRKWLSTTIGFETAEYHYQYIRPRAYAEAYIGDENDERLEIQFFCFNGEARHILVRNDLGDAARQPFAISYTIDWQRIKERRYENMTIDIPRPKQLDALIAIVNRLAKPFPHVRMDFYLVDDNIYLGEMTFTTSGNILANYTEDTLRCWGEELELPTPIDTRWENEYVSYANHK